MSLPETRDQVCVISLSEENESDAGRSWNGTNKAAAHNQKLKKIKKRTSSMSRADGRPPRKYYQRIC